MKKKKQQSDCTDEPSQQSSLNVSSVAGSSSQPDYYPDNTNQDADAEIDDCISERHSLIESATLIQTSLSSLEDRGAVSAVVQLLHLKIFQMKNFRSLVLAQLIKIVRVQ